MRNFKLVRKLWEKKMTQYELAKRAGISSEARLSRIINGLVKPTTIEVKNISTTLETSEYDLDLIIPKLTSKKAAL